MHSKITQYIAFISYLIPVLSLQKPRYLVWLTIFFPFLFPTLISRETLFPLLLRKENMHRLRIVCHIIEVQVYNCSNEPAFRARETVCNFSPWCDAQTFVGERTECSRKRHPPNIYWNGQTNNLHTCSAHFSKILLETVSLRSPPALPPRW